VARGIRRETKWEGENVSRGGGQINDRKTCRREKVDAKTTTGKRRPEGGEEGEKRSPGRRRKATGKRKHKRIWRGDKDKVITENLSPGCGVWGGSGHGRWQTKLEE
jgi:hypothetical protein